MLFVLRVVLVVCTLGSLTLFCSDVGENGRAWVCIVVRKPMVFCQKECSSSSGEAGMVSVAFCGLGPAPSVVLLPPSVVLLPPSVVWLAERGGVLRAL